MTEKMTAFQIAAIALLSFAPFAGSFLGVLADRLCRDEDVVAKPSACRSCGTRLRVRDLIPVVSFLRLSGRCAACGTAIPRWILLIELAAFALACVAVALGRDALEIWLIAVFLWCLLALFACDCLWFRLPDLLTGALLALALALSLVTGWPPPGQALVGAAVGAGVFLALRLAYSGLRGREGLGLGDVKLMAGLGAAFGPWDLPLLVLIAALGALAAAGVTGALHATRALPFGAALCAAAAVLWTGLRLV